MLKNLGILSKICTFFEKLVDPYPSEILTVNSNRFFLFLWNSAYGFKKYIAAMMFFSCLAGTFESLIFFILGQIVDHVVSLTDFNNIWEECKYYLLVFGILIVLSPITIMFLTLFKFQTIQGNFPMMLRWKFHRVLLKRDVNFFSNEFSGDLATKVMQTALAVRNVIISLCDTSIFISIYFLSAAIVLAKFDFILLLPFFIWLIFYIIICIHFIPKLTQVAQEQAKERSFITGLISDIYSNIISVKLFSHSNKELEYTRNGMQQMMIPVYKQQRLVSYFDLIVYTLSIIMTFAVFILTFYAMILGQVGPGAVAASTAIALRFSSISQWAMWVIADLFEHIGTVQDGINILQYKSKENNIDYKNTSFMVTKGYIDFSNISFCYDKNSKKILEDFNMKLSPGEKVGLVGSSGVGKSTIIKLLVRLYDPQKGKIFIDGQDIKMVKHDLLRSKISVITQDTLLFHRSIRDNLLIANPSATEQEIIEAAKRAGAHEFIKEFRDSDGNSGYNANVGEKGIKLSGGQKQRIAIARVILKNSPILILDEATSALDSNLEAVIQDNLQEIMEGKTVLSIAHRLSTLTSMDRLLIIDDGKIIEEGSHNSLLEKHGVYSKLWNRQIQGFI